MQGRHKQKLSNGCCISFESALILRNIRYAVISTAEDCLIS
jgi:hypothetical protein